ncbi:peroxidase-like [Trichoplusia ni]|uniref:Peroxidase-like n=1 Tax=Trichoplusia ni TaxID=7111 RepID=A0A7E5WGL4_TRINI|nr:peroxidase-like [Trichoplusia ni]
MSLKCVVAIFLLANLAFGVRYDYHSSQPVSKSLLTYYENLNATDTCTFDIAPCDPNEWRRLDGSCNNLNQPAKGAYFVPMIRLLDSVYHNGNEPRKAADGEDLPLPRKVRTALLKIGKSSHPELSQQVPSFAAYVLMDIASIHDIEKMLLEKTDCCEPEHMNDPECTPNIIPEDDPIHRFSGIRCLNLTRPQTYQDFHCTQEKVPSLIIRATPSFDSSPIYNQFNDGEKARTYKDGLLITEEENGRLFPPTGPRGLCLLNQAPKETRCYQNHLNSVLPIHMYTLWFYRNHNFIAKELAKVNPHWDDETLFQTARDINIAFQQNMYFYEWLPAVMGYDNLVKAGILNKDQGFRDVYDDKLYPVMTLEYNFALRWFHTMIEATSHLYDKEGNKVGDMPLLEILFRTGWVPQDKNEEYITNGFIRQPCHNPDHSIDYDISERGLPLVQRVLDLATSDMHKNRLFGLAPYVDYVKLFNNITVNDFEDLSPLIDEENIYKLSLLYKNVRDIDLMAGMWSERHMQGGSVSKTLGDITLDALSRSIKGDRHWYERPNRPHAFNKVQLKEIRKSSLARLLCNVGEGVGQVVKRGFYNVGPKNPLVSCSEIPQMKFSAWKE